MSQTIDHPLRGSERRRLGEARKTTNMALLPECSKSVSTTKVLRSKTRPNDASISSLMFIRFASGDVDPDARVRAGLFCALYQLCWSDEVPEYELDALKEIEDWFDENLASPPDALTDDWRYAEGVFWFKSSATNHLSRAWEMVEILERNDVLVWTIRSRNVGDIYYEDEVQVFARPTRSLRRALRR